MEYELTVIGPPYYNGSLVGVEKYLCSSEDDEKELRALRPEGFRFARSVRWVVPDHLTRRS